MCHICKDKFSVHEKIAAHDFSEQMREFYGLSVKEPKRHRLTKKSLLARIENELGKLQIENNQKHVARLENLILEDIDLETMDEKFKIIMEEYYQDKLKDETNAG